MTVTKILGAQSGIQYQGVQDKSEADPRDALVNVLFTGEFKRGPFNQPFKVTAANIRKKLGFDPDNLQYQAVEDCLKQGVPFVWVMRVSATDSITATYDSFYQTITATGKAGLLIETKDPNNNVIGSGIIPAEGSVTYTIDEGLLHGGEVITTKSSTSNSVNHSIVASFSFAKDSGPFEPYVFIQQDMNLNWLKPPVYNDSLPSNISGEVIVEYGESQYIVDLSLYAGQENILLTKTGVKVYPYTYDSKSTDGPTNVKIRFRNVNSNLFLQVGQADRIYKFFNDGVQSVGYQLAWRKTGHPNVVLKDIPSYLPPSVKNMNAMFYGDEASEYLFESAQIEAKLANWDVSNVTKMIDTFAFALFYDLPVGNWNPINLEYAQEAFGYSNFNHDINWDVPKLISVEYMLGYNSVFNSNINMKFNSLEIIMGFLEDCISFNKPVEHLNTSKVTDFNSMLCRCSSFNQPLNLLNTSNGTDFAYMLEGASKFNQPLNLWNVSKATTMHVMFKDCPAFNQNISNWCVPLILQEPDGFNTNGILTAAQKPVWGTCPA